MSTMVSIWRDTSILLETPSLQTSLMTRYKTIFPLFYCTSPHLERAELSLVEVDACAEVELDICSQHASRAEEKGGEAACRIRWV